MYLQEKKYCQYLRNGKKTFIFKKRENQERPVPKSRPKKEKGKPENQFPTNKSSHLVGISKRKTTAICRTLSQISTKEDKMEIITYTILAGLYLIAICNLKKNVAPEIN